MSSQWVGTSGWRYPSWRHDFYPDGLPQRRELEYLGQTFNSVEINGSFYSLQRPSAYRTWADQTPERFTFAVKGSRFITHMLRLRDVRPALANFFASGVLLLGQKLGPVLWQLPERATFDRELMEAFSASLPKTLAEAAVLAAQHDDRIKNVEIPDVRSDQTIRYALEARHPSFDTDEAAAALRRHGIALVTADTAGRWPLMTRSTADFVYVRLHGSRELYTSGYTRAELERWATLAREAAGRGRKNRTPRDIYVYFDNDAEGHAPFDALAMAEVLRAG